MWMRWRRLLLYLRSVDWVGTQKILILLILLRFSNIPVNRKRIVFFAMCLRTMFRFVAWFFRRSNLNSAAPALARLQERCMWKQGVWVLQHVDYGWNVFNPFVVMTAFVDKEHDVDQEHEWHGRHSHGNGQDAFLALYISMCGKSAVMMRYLSADAQSRTAYVLFICVFFWRKMRLHLNLECFALICLLAGSFLWSATKQDAMNTKEALPSPAQDDNAVALTAEGECTDEMTVELTLSASSKERQLTRSGSGGAGEDSLVSCPSAFDGAPPSGPSDFEQLKGTLIKVLDKLDEVSVPVADMVRAGDQWRTDTTERLNELLRRTAYPEADQSEVSRLPGTSLSRPVSPGVTIPGGTDEFERIEHVLQKTVISSGLYCLEPSEIRRIETEGGNTISTNLDNRLATDPSELCWIKLRVYLPTAKVLLVRIRGRQVRYPVIGPCDPLDAIHTVVSYMKSLRDRSIVPEIHSTGVRQAIRVCLASEIGNEPDRTGAVGHGPENTSHLDLVADVVLWIQSRCDSYDASPSASSSPSPRKMVFCASPAAPRSNTSDWTSGSPRCSARPPGPRLPPSANGDRSRSIPPSTNGDRSRSIQTVLITDPECLKAYDRAMEAPSAG